MTFPTTPALAFTASVSTISAATANAWRGYFPQALDAVGGGTYANTSAITFSAGSAGWVFGSLVTLNSTSNVTFSGGGTVTINSDPSLFGTMRVGVGAAGGGVRFYATSTLQVDDTVAMSIAGDATWTGASTQVHANLSTDTYSAGSVLAINTASATLGTAATLTVNGAAGGGNTATVAFGQYSTITIASGAAVTATIGGGGVTSTITVGADGDFVRASGSTDTYQSGAALSTNQGSLVNMVIGKTAAGTMTYGSLAVVTHESSSTETYDSGSTLNLNGTVMRTGSETRSGTGAHTVLRVQSGADADTSYNGGHYDIIDAGLALSAPRIYTLTGSSNVALIIRNASPHKLTIKEGGTTVCELDPGVGNNQSVIMFYSGTWKAGPKGALVPN